MFQFALRAAEHREGVSIAPCSSFSGCCLTAHDVTRLLMCCSRTDVVTVTPWLAPIVWEGTFNPVLLDSIYKPQNISIAATVFAVGK